MSYPISSPQFGESLVADQIVSRVMPRHHRAGSVQNVGVDWAGYRLATRCIVVYHNCYLCHGSHVPLGYYCCRGGTNSVRR